MKKRIVQLEESHEKQQERLDILERENHMLKTEINNFNGNKAVGSALKRTEKDQDQEKETESKPASTSSDKKKTKTNSNNNNDDESVVIPQRDNGDSFDSLSDDLLHKVVEFDGNWYSKFRLINKRCKNIYDVKEYKLKKQTCLYGYGTVDMMLERYLQKRREGSLDCIVRYDITRAVICYNRFDAIDWIIQLGDSILIEDYVNLQLITVESTFCHKCC